METLQIKKADALKAYNNTDQKGKTLLSDLFGKELLPAKERIKTVEDALDALAINRSEFAAGLRNLTRDEAAYRQLKVVADALNEGWQANWTDTNQRKFYPYFDGGAGFRFRGVYGYYRVSHVSSRLCFKSSELAEYAGRQFQPFYQVYLNS